MSDEPSVSTPNVVFAGTACFHCMRAPPAVPPLKRCSGCKRIKYCSATCSKDSWSSHKPFCLAFSALRARPHAYLPPLYSATEESLDNRRETQRSMWLLEDDLLRAAMGNKITKVHEALLWREPRCGVCWDREGDVEKREGQDEGKEGKPETKAEEVTGTGTGGKEDEDTGRKKGESVSAKGWRVCEDCRLVPWCSTSHEDLNRKDHKEKVGPYGFTECQTLQLSNDIDEFQLRHKLASPGVPPKQWMPAASSNSSSPLNRPKDWKSYLSPHLAVLSANKSPKSPTPTSAEVYGVWVEGLSPVLTALSMLPSPPPLTQDGTLTIFVLIPSPPPPHLLALYEELLHSLQPEVRHLRLEFFPSPSSLFQPLNTKTKEEKQTTCKTCLEQDRSRTHILHPAPLHLSLPDDSSESDGSVTNSFPPALVIAYDPSISASSEIEEQSGPGWKRTFEILRAKNWRGAFTATTEKEAVEDCEMAAVAGGEGQVSVRRNVWAGGWPRVDLWEEDGGVWRSNGWVWTI
ncbi:hypothetical protein T439DRAFT_380249 [Meredithblackwellia eburnea MCA 4105]